MSAIDDPGAELTTAELPDFASACWLCGARQH
jgi:hypothetical protein